MSTNQDVFLSDEGGEHWEVTSSLIERHISLKWMIEKFSRRKIDGYPKIQSPTFNFLSSKWHLSFYPNGDGSKSEGRVMLFLYIVKPVSETKVKCKMCLKDKNGVNYDKVEFQKVFSAEDNGWGGTLIDRKVLLEKNQNALLYGDILNIYCDICGWKNVERELKCVDQPTITKRKENETSNIPKSLETLVKDLEGLFKERRNCDVTLQVGDQTFPAHKCLLIARSKVFAAMFEHDMKESGTNVITITDIEGKVVSDLLQYIYTGNIKEMSVEKAIELYVAADKYAMLELKAQSSDFLRTNLSDDNICEIAVFADAHNDGNIMDAVKLFASKNTSVLTTEKWERLAEQNTRLAYEVALALALTKPAA